MAAGVNRVAVTGLGVLAPNGIGREAFWTSLLENRSGVGPITLFDASDLACRIAGEVRGFEPEDYIDAALKPKKRLARFTQLGLAATVLAVEDAGLARNELRRMKPLPVVLGISASAMDLIGRKPSPTTAVCGVPHAVTSALGYMLNAQPQLTTFSDGCASSLDAVACAADMIRRGKADLIVSGGAESGVERYTIQAMLQCRRCSTRNDEPQKASRPFDRDRDYGVMAEAGGIVILESFHHAQARGARIYAEIVGYGACADPVDGEEASGLPQAAGLALANAGLHKRDVDYICAHGPSDIDMDRLETRVIKEMFGPLAYRIPVTSIKGATGCPLGAGGVLQFITSALIIREGIVPPTTNYELPDPTCDLDYVPRAPRRHAVNVALINTHGFGRGNGCMLLQRPPP
jgi:3-oxoacyl-[acyl-carrier-protein] synthase II